MRTLLRQCSVAESLLVVVIAAVVIGGGLSAVNPLRRGVRALYFTNSHWIDPPAFTAREQALTLDRMARVLPRQTTAYSIQWIGYLRAPVAGEYEFTLVSDDGSSLFLNQQLVVDNGGFHGKQERSGRQYLAKGFHALHVNYMQGQDVAIFRAFWTPPGQTPRPLSQAELTLRPLSDRAYWAGRMIEWLVRLSRLVGSACLLAGAAYWLAYSRPAWLRLRQRLLCAALLIGVFVTHFGLSSVATPWDSKWSIHTALSLIREGNADLDEYAPITQIFQDHTVVEYFGHTYNLYPIGTPVLAVPLVWLIDRFMAAGWGLDMEGLLNEHRLIPAGLEQCVASVIVAATTMLIYLIGMRLGVGHAAATATALILAFGTSAWSTASRALWQHGPTMLMLALALFLFVLAERAPRHAPVALRLLALPLAFACVIRPTNVISLAAFSALLFIRYRRYVLAYSLWGLAVAAPFVVYSLHVYRAPLPPYYTAGGQLGGSAAVFLEALAGTLISPSRGLFVFSPVLFFSMYGMVRRVRSRAVTALDVTLAAILVLHWMVSALHPNWWGGHSYGPRYLTDTLPYLVYFLFPALCALSRLRGWRKTVVVSVLVATAALSVGIHWRGATNRVVYAWNAGPVSVDVQPSRVWDWRDPQFLRGL
jgi:hypothetical protein